MFIGIPNPNAVVPLKKLKIKLLGGAKTHDGKTEFEVLYNPESYTQRRHVHYSDRAGLSMDTPITQFSHGHAEILTFSLFFDSMSAGAEVGGTIMEHLAFGGNSLLASAASAIDVRKYTQRVYGLMEIDESLHVPPLVELHWSELNFRGHLIGCQQTFTRFSETGAALRARLECMFRGFLGNIEKKSLQSPDTTKFRTVHQGESLWAFAAREYGDAGAWREIARANGLENPRLLRSGDVIALPALK